MHSRLEFSTHANIFADEHSKSLYDSQIWRVAVIFFGLRHAWLKPILTLIWTWDHLFRQNGQSSALKGLVVIKSLSTAIQRPCFWAEFWLDLVLRDTESTKNRLIKGSAKREGEQGLWFHTTYHPDAPPIKSCFEAEDLPTSLITLSMRFLASAETSSIFKVSSLSAEEAPDRFLTLDDDIFRDLWNLAVNDFQILVSVN